ncbi:ferric reductase [Pollutimonas nitritireducens]|uniref:Ferric reductase n=1 Tax=Pollutimonas nitritireducens TaxID=2045209 RepID=A0A2N4UFX1_9BURK|nr:ferric reductase-like transmembrane domain-containing protein [Pollutimonas nitritireducens]PLC53918.1 ferric reductase [Pollutimonas nitritireducens]
MKTRTLLVGFLGILTAAWAWDALYVNPMYGDWPWLLRQHGLYLTGIWSISLMSLVMVLATRPAWLEGPLGGMDKIYHLHKWGGILSILFAAAHWLIEMAGDLLRDLIGKSGRPAKEAVFYLFQPLRSEAKDVGEIAIYLLLGLLVLALWRRFPYRPWRLLHKAMPVLYLMLVMHVVALMPLAYWSGQTGLLQAVLLAGGTVAAAIALAQRIGRHHQHAGRIDSFNQHGDVLEVVCDPGTGWTVHRPGQFAFVRFDRLEGAHPFTIASAPKRDSRLITFQIKALGDYTRKLSGRLYAGQPVMLEGPYGRLDWRRGRKDAAQVWVAGGIGVTPFLAWLESMQDTPSAVPVQMHYCVRDAKTDPFVKHIRNLCATLPNVSLHLHDASHSERLGASRLLAAGSPRNGKMDVWFCGPAGFARSLDESLRRLLGRGLRMHREAFEMR